MRRISPRSASMQGASLTSILDYGTKEYRDFRTFLRNSFPKPRQRLESNLIVPAASASPSLIGTAFDYLLRFHLEKRFRAKVTSTTWVSENAINGYFREPGIGFRSYGFDEDLNAQDIRKLMAVKKLAIKRFAWCRKVHARFLQAKRNDSSQLLEACLFLAKLDNIYRRGLPTADELRILLDVDEEDVGELKALIDCCDLEQFRPKRYIILNPRFNTEIINADADIIIDEMLVDVKVTKHLKLTREHLNQLIGYYLLYLSGGIRTKRKVKISKLGIYFARHAFLWTINVDSIGDGLLFGRAAEILKQSLEADDGIN